MEVCEYCHETDKRVTKCAVPLIHHTTWYRGFIGTCEICGKLVDMTYTCVAYEKYMDKQENG